MLEEPYSSNQEPSRYDSGHTGKESITLMLDTSILNYFKSLSTRYGMPYEELISACLTDCCKRKLTPKIQWDAY